MPAMRSPSSAQKGCICHVILNEGERLFQTQYIYIYIYMIVDKGVVDMVSTSLHGAEKGKVCTKQPASW